MGQIWPCLECFPVKAVVDRKVHDIQASLVIQGQQRLLQAFLQLPQAKPTPRHAMKHAHRSGSQGHGGTLSKEPGRRESGNKGAGVRIRSWESGSKGRNQHSKEARSQEIRGVSPAGGLHAPSSTVALLDRSIMPCGWVTIRCLRCRPSCNKFVMIGHHAYHHCTPSFTQQGSKLHVRYRCRLGCRFRDVYQLRCIASCPNSVHFNTCTPQAGVWNWRPKFPR